MPTKHRRIAIIRDGEVDAALARARKAGEGPQSDASVARELLLRGAGALGEGDEDDEWRRWVLSMGGTPAEGSMRDFLDERGPLPPYDPEDPHPATEALEKLREERL